MYGFAFLRVHPYTVCDVCEVTLVGDSDTGLKRAERVGHVGMRSPRTRPSPHAPRPPLLAILGPLR
eukprot:scaffold21597_cov108-Isochrysis_galbana.AAC.1